MRVLAAGLMLAALWLGWYAVGIWDRALHGGSPLRLHAPRTEEQLRRMMETEYGPRVIAGALEIGRDGYRFLDDALTTIGIVSALLMFAACVVFAFGSVAARNRAKLQDTEAKTEPN